VVSGVVVGYEGGVSVSESDGGEVEQGSITVTYDVPKQSLVHTLKQLKDV